METALTNFDVVEVPLKGSNLIEASAGTGKTYSIAILVVRMVIEKNIELKEILMVTFTKAAVAELEVRIRKFIREAYSYASHNSKIDSTIQTIVDNGINSYGKNEVIILLNKARKQLDETSIFTIHSFCQKTLTEFAFETGQAFGSNVIEDEAALITQATNKYWRENITTLNTELLTILVDHGLAKAALFNVVAKSSWGKKFIFNEKLDLNNSLALLNNLEEKISAAMDVFNDTFSASTEKSLDNIGNKGHAFNAFSSLTDNANAFRNKLIEKQSAAYVQKKFPQLLELAIEVQEAEHELENTAKAINYFLYGHAITYSQSIIRSAKDKQSLFSFDDLITKLHSSIDSEILRAAIRKQYKAVFIDEFQDTDQKQYEIFNTLFNKHSILFYIGDPKQSIYSFKGTDIDTYLDASKSVDDSFTMSSNYRSTAGYIKAMNSLFSNTENPFFDTRINYEKVKAGMTIPELTLDSTKIDPLLVYKCANNTEIINQTANQVMDLLTGDYKIGDRKVMPSDIGILVRANAKGTEIKKKLNKLSIPAITIDDSRVMESEQSTLIANILKAIFEPNKPNINKALLTYLTNKTKEDLLSAESEEDIEIFKKLNRTWIEKGVFSALNSFMDAYNVLSTIYKKAPTNAERIITNILQINEIIHKKEIQSKLSPKEVIHWLVFAIAGAEVSGDFTQRLENDEDAVKIVTIHKSKGLAYNIVIAPYLDLSSDHNSKWDIIEYKDPALNKYCFSYDKTATEEKLYSEQTERENRRLIYVALTRAVYMGIIIHNTRGAKATNGIKPFLDASIAKNHLNFSTNLEDTDLKYNDRKSDTPKVPKTFSATPINSKWNSYSFSLLNKYEKHTNPAPLKLSDNYDKFIFNSFPRGDIAGNFMHYLFENINFTTNDFSSAIKRAKNKYASIFGTSTNYDLDFSLNEMLVHVLNAKLPISNSFTLAQLTNENRLVEMGFNYKMEGFSTKDLQKLIPDINLATLGNIQGFMTGFIDLLFEHEGKFYILDWKSNYLGNSTENYEPVALEKAVIASNYHLQYHIYTLATKLYLQNCVPNFNFTKHFGGVIYVYTRGCRSGEGTGIYYTMPELDTIVALEKLMVK
ncbi:MAG: UvrD-helicase domain-containing protein [Salinivirgaceae bacterium]|nr:UvrD-helicase domain-containing protein [Salinivirgaceae bacterium]